MATKKINPAQEKARQELFNYLLSNNLLGFQFPSTDTTYLTEVGKLYEDLALSKGMYDSVTPKYRALGDNPRALMMKDYFDAIITGADPDQVIKEHDDANALNPDLKLNDTEKADLKKFATEQASRNETLWEREQAAAYYGLPSPTQQLTIPTELVAGLRAQKTGLTNAQAIDKQLTAMQQEYDKMMAKTPKKDTYTIKTKDVGIKDDPGVFFYNALVGPGRDIALNVERPVSESPTAATPNSPRVGAIGKQMNQLEKLALAEMDYDNRLAEAVAQRISEQYGTSYEAATKEAQRLVASRKKGASGNWLQ